MTGLVVLDMCNIQWMICAGVVYNSNTYRSAQHAMEFQQLPSMMVKGKEHPIEVYMPTGALINKVQTGPEMVKHSIASQRHCVVLAR